MVWSSSEMPDEAPLSLKESLDVFSLEWTPNQKLIRWATGNPRHPRNWSMARKVYDTSVLIWLDLFTTAVSASGASAADSAVKEFNISHTFSIFMFVSLYLLGQALGGVLFPPFSECFGRKKLYIISTALYSLSCILVGTVPSLGGVIIGRFLSGFLSAIPTAVVAGSIEDMYNTKDRIFMIFLWSMVVNMGLVTGPIMSSYITNILGWRWVFHVSAIVTATTTLFLFGIHESRPSLRLAKEVKKLRKATGIEHLQAVNPDHVPDIHTFARTAIVRPLHLFFTEPIVFLVSTIAGVAFAMLYLFTEALPIVYTEMGFSDESASLPFLALAIGLISSVGTRALDHSILDKLHREGKPVTPESKLIGFSIGAPVLAGGLWLFAWTVPPLVKNIHWVVSASSLVLVGYSLNELDCVLAGYLADSYLSYASSGFAAMALVRALLSAVFPLFASQMYVKLGSNVATSILAGLATLFCVVPPLFKRHGGEIRRRSKFAEMSLQLYKENTIDENGY